MNDPATDCHPARVYYEQCSGRAPAWPQQCCPHCTSAPLGWLKHTPCRLHTYDTTHACSIQQAAPAPHAAGSLACMVPRLLVQLHVRMHQQRACCFMLADRHMAAAHPPPVAPVPALPCPATAPLLCYSANHGLGRIAAMHPGAQGAPQSPTQSARCPTGRELALYSLRARRGTPSSKLHA